MAGWVGEGMRYIGWPMAWTALAMAVILWIAVCAPNIWVPVGPSASAVHVGRR
jgi:hypothetical protein